MLGTACDKQPTWRARNSTLPGVSTPTKQKGGVGAPGQAEILLRWERGTQRPQLTIPTQVPTQAHKLILQQTLVNGSRTGPPWAMGHRGKASQTVRVHTRARNSQVPSS